MLIAICIQDRENELVGNAYLATIENNEVVHVEKEQVYIKDETYLALWIQRKQIEVLYMDDVTTKVKMFCRNWHIDVLNLEDMKETPILATLLNELTV